MHNRMSVILQPESEEEWLEKNSDKDSIIVLLKPYPSEAIRAYRVSSDIGNVRKTIRS
ncbi:SOS response-associated peptidase family protein [Paenibacillus sp. FSL R5-0473]|uniref:SOS response-associated peptidase family protein n=1 Tax=Paenibacillus sp. FSL R5-0473 TaxID=2921642 RepID=UPI004046EF67